MDRRLAAILIADVVGYTRLSHTDEEGTRRRFLDRRKRIFEPQIAQHHGRLIKTMGDGLLVEFPSIVNALRCAVDIQQAEAKENADLAADQQMVFRMGINLGDVIAEGDDVQGDGVNIADRLQGLADPGGIVISGSAYDYVVGKVDVELETLGEQKVKNIDHPIRAYRVRLDSSEAPRSRRINARFSGYRSIGRIVTAALLVGAGAGWWFWSNGSTTALATPAIAVMPFDNLSGDPSNSRLADGFTEDIITDLSRYRDFAVMARDSTAGYKNRPQDIREIGRALKVSHILSGSFRREGEQIRLTVQLIDAETGVQLWSERYDRPAGEVFAIESEVADRIANSLAGAEGQVAGSIVAAAKRKLPKDLGAYELYLLGMEKMHTGLTLDNQLEAAELFKRALAIDPTLARAHTGLAMTDSWQFNLEADPSQLLQDMLKEARQAVDLDPMDARAHQALGYAYGLNEDFEQAELELDKALQLNPNSFEGLTVYSCWASEFGKAKAGADVVDRAIRLNPNYPAWAGDCFKTALLMAGRYEDVLKNQTRQPEDKWNPDSYVMTAGSLAALGRLDEAKDVAARGVAKYPEILTIEKFALNHSWSPQSAEILSSLMRKADFPACAKDSDLKGIAKPIRLPECLAGSHG